MSADEIARQTTENFFRLFNKVPRVSGERRMSLTFTILGCGSSMGVPRVALGWGECDPNNPKNRRRRCAVGGAHERSGHAPAFWSTARRICRKQLLDAEVDWLDGVLDHPRARRPHPRHRRSAPAVRPQAPARAGLPRRADLARYACPLRLLLHDAARQRISADFDRAPAGAGAAGDHRRAGRRRSRFMPVLQKHGDIPSLGFRFGNVAYSADIKSLPPESLAALAGPRRLDRGRAAPGAASQPFQSRRGFGLDRPREAETGDPDQPAQRYGLRRALAPACRPGSNRPMTGCGSRANLFPQILMDRIGNMRVICIRARISNDPSIS